MTTVFHKQNVLVGGGGARSADASLHVSGKTRTACFGPDSEVYQELSVSKLFQALRERT